MFHPPNGVLCESIDNPNVMVSHHYNIVQYLSEDPCATSTLDFLQIYPMQCRSPFNAIIGFDPLLMVLDTTKIQGVSLF